MRPIALPSPLAALRRRAVTWWESRIPRRDQQTLTQRNLYILPTKAGWSFGVVFLVLLLASINEQINLGYALSFLLSGTAMAALYQTHGNLHGVRMRLGVVRSVHAGQVLQVGISLHNSHRQRGRFGLQIVAGPQAPEGTTEGPGCPREAELAPGSEQTVEVDVAAPTRGWLTLPPITIETRFPLGLFRAWAHWRPETQVLIWPALDPHAPTLPALSAAAASTGQAQRMHKLNDQPESLRDYRRGDALSAIAWRKSSPSLARGGDPISREPAQGRSADLLLDFEHSAGMQGLNAEQRLSRLATWLHQAEQHAAAHGPMYGLGLPGLTLPCGSGPQHLRDCLDALATWSAR
ncbi:MAG: hypothetical protein RI920_1197 [Pseudomonadota bacterium]|jgi:uncharacterized protein (DUF58 family)